MTMLTFQRIDLQDHLRRLRTNPGEDDLKRIEQLRGSINAEFVELEALQRGVSDIPASFSIMPEKDDIFAFDNLDEEEAAFDSDDDHPASDQNHPAPASGLVSPEFRTLALPSTFHDPYPPHCAVELTLRTQQALQQLNALRGAIADKSFQYSHIIREAPRKNVRTRARSGISKLNNIISFHCR
jgi:hypothetical protein